MGGSRRGLGEDRGVGESGGVAGAPEKNQGVYFSYFETAERKYDIHLGCGCVLVVRKARAKRAINMELLNDSKLTFISMSLYFMYSIMLFYFILLHFILFYFN